MQAEERLRILKECHYGKDYILAREGVNGSEISSIGYRDQGWGTLFLNFAASLNMLVDGSLALPLNKDNDAVNEYYRHQVLPRVRDVTSSYGHFSMIYNSYGLDEIEERMETEEDRQDLGVLFENRDRIQRLGKAILRLLVMTRRSNYQDIREQDDFQANYGIFEDFRDHIPDLENKIGELETRLG